MKRVLVTGAAGFIGSNLCFSLEEKGFEVVAVDNLYCGVWENLKGLKGSKKNWDVTQPLELEGPFDAVFHHGDITDPRYPRDEEVYERNLKGFQNSLEFARIKGAKLVYASTAGLYGNGPTPMKEDQKKEILTAYGRSKLEMDTIASKNFGKMHIVGLRYFNVFGPRESHKGRAASMIFHLYGQMKKGKSPRLFKYGEQQRDFIYVQDVVRANFCALLEGTSGVYNVGTGKAITFNELAECLNGVLGTRLSTEYFDMPYDRETYQKNTQADTTHAERQLGFTAKWGLWEAVSDYVNWLESSSLPW